MKYQHRVLGMLSLLAVITYVDRVCIAVAGPRMQDDLGISPERVGLGGQHLLHLLRRLRDPQRPASAIASARARC
jgi:hypothetical protein